MSESDEPSGPEVPREPMEGGSDRPNLGDDLRAAASSSWCDEGCDCGGLVLLRLSAIFTLAALILPNSAGGPVTVLIQIYRRLLTRFTPPCPSTPSCSAYALGAVQSFGARRGLVVAAERVRSCGRSGDESQGWSGSIHR